MKNRALQLFCRFLEIKPYEFDNGQNIFVVVYVAYLFCVFRRSRTRFLCPLSLKLSTLCATSGTAASDSAVLSMLDHAINRSVLCWGVFMFHCTSFSDVMRRFVGGEKCIMSHKHTGSDAAGEQRNSERWRGREDQDGAASSLPEPFCHCTPSGQPTQSPEIWQQSLGNRLLQHQGPFPLWTGQMCLLFFLCFFCLFVFFTKSH